MNKEEILKNAINELKNSGAAGASIILNNMNEQDQLKIITFLNKFKPINQSSFILGIMCGLGYFN